MTKPFIVRATLVVGLLIAASPTQAQDQADLPYYACFGFKPGEIIITRPVRMTHNPYDDWIKFMAAADFVPANDFHGSCMFADIAEDVEQKVVAWATSYSTRTPNWAIKRIDWTRPGDEKVRGALQKGQRSDRPKKPPPTASSGTGYLTVKTDTGLTDARKTYEQAVLQSQRADAAARAKQVADTARNKADVQAKLAKLFEELHKRGSAQ